MLHVQTLGDILAIALGARKREALLSARYRKGLASYGKPVKSEKRKLRIIAELNAMGVKPRVRRKMGKRYIGFKAYRASLQNPKRSQRTRFLWRAS